MEIIKAERAGFCFGVANAAMQHHNIIKNVKIPFMWTKIRKKVVILLEKTLICDFTH